MKRITLNFTFGITPSISPLKRICMVVVPALLLWIAGASQALGQGTVNLNNRITGDLVTHVYGYNISMLPFQVGNGSGDTPAGTVDWTGYPLLSGPNYMAVLLAAPGENRPDSELQCSATTTTFRTGSAAGCVAAVTAVLPNVPVDYPEATVRMFVWDNSSGLYSDPAAALQAAQSSTILAGKSPAFNVYKLGGGTNSTPNLTGLVSFNLHFLEKLPVITKEPQSQITRAGSNVVFSVEAYNCTKYQWRFGGTPIPGATEASLTLTNVQSYNQGDYSVAITNLEYSTNSASAHLTVLPSLVQPSLRASGPLEGLNPEGFRFAVLGPPGMVYQCETSTNLADWSTLGTITNANGEIQVLDSGAQTKKFYRVVQ